MNVRNVILAAGAALLLAAFPAMAKNPDAPNQGSNGPQVCVGQDPLAPEVAADVLYMREEEKLARDVYIAMEEAWEMQIFTNIIQAEQRHMDAILVLINCYDLVDPVVDDTPGVFTNPTLAGLYATLVAAGLTSPLDALMVGALIEEQDIVDLRAALATSDNVDVDRVFANLMCASENHLRSFASQIEQAGATYVAQFLTQTEFEAIADSPRVPCGVGPVDQVPRREQLMVQNQFQRPPAER